MGQKFSPRAHVVRFTSITGSHLRPQESEFASGTHNPTEQPHSSENSRCPKNHTPKYFAGPSFWRPSRRSTLLRLDRRPLFPLPLVYRPRRTRDQVPRSKCGPVVAFGRAGREPRGLAPAWSSLLASPLMRSARAPQAHRDRRARQRRQTSILAYRTLADGLIT